VAGGLLEQLLRVDEAPLGGTQRSAEMCFGLDSEDDDEDDGGDGDGGGGGGADASMMAMPCVAHAAHAPSELTIACPPARPLNAPLRFVVERRD
jgi:hypothetical protein